MDGYPRQDPRFPRSVDAELLAYPESLLGELERGLEQPDICQRRGNVRREVPKRIQPAMLGLQAPGAFDIRQPEIDVPERDPGSSALEERPKEEGGVTQALGASHGTLAEFECFPASGGNPVTRRHVDKECDPKRRRLGGWVQPNCFNPRAA